MMLSPDIVARLMRKSGAQHKRNGSQGKRARQERALQRFKDVVDSTFVTDQRTGVTRPAFSSEYESAVKQYQTLYNKLNGSKA